MKMDMTERDKKLLIFLVLFLIVVCIGYWGVRPIVKNIIKTNDAIEEAQSEKEVNELKIMELPMLISENQTLEDEIIKARGNFYPMMSSDEIDKMFTGMALDYNLYAYQMDITMPTEEAILDPYKYSVKAMTADEEIEEMSLPEDTSEEADDSEVKVEETAGNGIYMAEVVMRVSGDEVMLQKLINDLSASDKKHLVKAYSWETVTNNEMVFNGGTYELETKTDKYIYITIDIYMCQE